MSRRDFRAYYAALELQPGATDQEISRAKRAYNELYHSDRLAHMSEQARAIAAEKVQAANEAAQALLDPANRSARDLWVREARRGHNAGNEWQSETPPGGATRPHGAESHSSQPAEGSFSEAAPPRAARSRREKLPGRLILVGLIAGGLLATLGAVAREVRGRRALEAVPAPRLVLPATRTPAEPAPDPALRRPAPAGARAVVDSVVWVPGDGQWTRPVAIGGDLFRASFVPESETANYRVRADGSREVVLLGEPSFQRVAGAVHSLEFSSLTGAPLRLRFSRWRMDAPPGKAVHLVMLPVPADGSWSSRVFLGGLAVRWDANRPVSYEAQDDRGRIVHVLPSVRSILFKTDPKWIRFRSTDALPLTLTVHYTTP